MGSHGPQRAASRNDLWDKAGVGLSTACMLHCTSLPLLVALSPSLFGNLLDDASFHQWMLFLILPTAIIAFGFSWWRHRRLTTLITGIIGLVLLIIAASLGHAVLGELGEKLLTTIGGLFLISGHVVNLLRSRRSPVH
ncbi:MAG: hypothetical protein Tsb002_14140 [Wenzhouxiangellaceae bacterium]